MDEIRKRRLEALIQREISEYIYRKIKKKDDRIGFISVTRVDLAGDFSFAKIFFSLFAPTEAENATNWRILNKYRGQMQSDISKQLRLRKTPRFEFLIDTSIKEGDKVLELMEKHKESSQAPGDLQEH